MTQDVSKEDIAVKRKWWIAKYDTSSGYVQTYLFVPWHGNLCSGVTIISFSFRFAVIVISYFQSNKCRIDERFYFAILISKHLRTDVILIRVRFQLHVNSISVLASYYSGWSLTELKVTKWIKIQKLEVLKEERFFKARNLNGD